MTKPSLSEFEAARVQPTRVCWFRRLTVEQQAKVRAAKESGYANTTIAKVVSTWGPKVTASSLARHFGRSCACD